MDGGYLAQQNEAKTSPCSVTILWSTQTGRAKACARRAARIIRSQKCVDVKGGGYGCAFDDSGPEVLAVMQPRSCETSWLLLFVSTTGDGEQCDCIIQTWKALRSRSLPSNLFSEVRFALFCLGDRAYGQQFCAGGRKLAARMVQLGAEPFCDVGYGDDGTPNGGVFYDLDIWLEETLMPAIDKRFRGKLVTDKLLAESELQHIQRCYRASFHNSEKNQQLHNGEWRTKACNLHYEDYFSRWCPMTAYQYDGGRRLRSDGNSPTSPLSAEIMVNERITSPNWEQETRHLQILVCFSQASEDVGNEQSSRHAVEDLPYQAGDVATVLPFNTEEDVSSFLDVLPPAIASVADQYMEIFLDDSIGGATSIKAWPRHCTLRGLLTYCTDICSLPEREDLRVLSYYCNPEHEMGQSQREKLLSLSETSGAALYADYVLREKRSWTDVLYDFDSIRFQGATNSTDDHALTLEALLALLPPIRPRHFSIASAPSQDKLSLSTAPVKQGEGFSIDLCVAVVKGTTPLGRHFKGLCSNFLADQLPNNGRRICLWIRPGSFGNLPLKTVSCGASIRYETPVLCVGAGTGIAPLRSLILERESVLQFSLKQDAVEPSVDEDSITRDSTMVDNLLVFGCRKEKADYYYVDEWKPLVEHNRLVVLTAFSRDQWHKIYVQQLLGKAEKSEMMISRHILDRSGAIYVAGGAKMARAVRDEILECLTARVGDKQAQLILKRLQQMGRYSVEAWS